MKIISHGVLYFCVLYRSSQLTKAGLHGYDDGLVM